MISCKILISSCFCDVLISHETNIYKRVFTNQLANVPFCRHRIVVSEVPKCALEETGVGFDNALPVGSVPLVSPLQSGSEGRLLSKLFSAQHTEM